MSSPLELWSDMMLAYPSPEILWTGAKPWDGTPSHSYFANAPHGRWLGTDIEGGEGVDIVGDLHYLDTITDRRFQGIFSPSTLEHVARPWIAFKALANLLADGGCLYLHSHQTFPIHGYPSDYFRFTGEAMRVMAEDAGLEVIETGYDHPCQIHPPAGIVWNPSAPAFLNVTIVAVKP